MKKNDVFIVNITDISTEGEGIGKVDAFPFFIKDTCIGDKVEFSVTLLKKNYGYGRLIRVLEASPYRTDPCCPAARSCGGCQLQHMNYQAQLDFKTNKVRQNLMRIGGFKDPEVLPCIGMEQPFRYRNKSQVPFGKNKEGDIIAGFYAGRTHTIIDRETCMITFPGSDEILRIIKRWMKARKIETYNETEGTGLVRHVLMRKGYHTGQIMVCLIVNAGKVPYLPELTEELKKIPGFTTLCLNINKTRGNTILGKETRAVYGPGVIRDRIGDLSFEISANAFFQVNPVQTEVLYGKALEFANLTGTENVWDLYCGAGTISLFLARKAKKVYGVEIIPQAVENARKNAEYNGISNAAFFTGKAEEVLPEWTVEHPDEKIDIIVVDPPRKGCDRKLLETMIRMAPEKIVYVSCDSATLSRDLSILAEGGYKINIIQPVDMFPQTTGVECCVLLERVNNQKADSYEASMRTFD